MSTTLLGLNYAFHDSSACIVRDGQLVCALEEERFTRRKHTSEFPETCVERCLEITGASPQDIRHIAISVQPWLHWQRKLAYRIANPRKVRPFLRYELYHTARKDRAFSKWYRALCPTRPGDPRFTTFLITYLTARAAFSSRHSTRPPSCR